MLRPAQALQKVLISHEHESFLWAPYDKAMKVVKHTNQKRVDFISVDKLNSLDFNPSEYSMIYVESITNPSLKVLKAAVLSFSS